jgi:hypothetical protein
MNLISVELSQNGVLRFERCRPLAQPHGPTHLTLIVFRHVNHDGVARGWVDLRGVRVFAVENVASKLDDGALQPQADAQVWLFVGAGPVGRCNLSFNTPSTETTGNKNS